MKVRLRERGKRRWMFLTGKGTETYLRIHAANYPDDKAREIAAGIVEDNPTWEAEAVS